MKILLNRQPVNGPWGGGNNFIISICNYFPIFGHEITYNIYDKIDIIFLQSPFPDNNLNFSINDAILLKKKNPNLKIILRVNDCDARKNTTNIDDAWIKSSFYIDKTIFVSNWIKDYFINKGWACKDNKVIYNGVNKDHFKPDNKLNNGKTNIVTHHWSNNRMKGFDLYEEIDKFTINNLDYTFTYIGRELGTFKNTNIIKPLFGKFLGKELSKYDIYISGTKFDPGPNHILESIACEIPTYCQYDGGGAVEFVGINNSFKETKDLINLLKTKNFIKNDMLIDEWENITKNILNFIEN